MAEYLLKTYKGTKMSMHKQGLRELKRLADLRGNELFYDKVNDEPVANAINRLLEDGNVMERIAQIRQMDKSLADKIIERIRNFYEDLK